MDRYEGNRELTLYERGVVSMARRLTLHDEAVRRARWEEEKDLAFCTFHPRVNHPGKYGAPHPELEDCFLRLTKKKEMPSEEAKVGEEPTVKPQKEKKNLFNSASASPSRNVHYRLYIESVTHGKPRDRFSLPLYSDPERDEAAKQQIEQREAWERRMVVMRERALAREAQRVEELKLREQKERDAENLVKIKLHHELQKMRGGPSCLSGLPVQQCRCPSHNHREPRPVPMSGAASPKFAGTLRQFSAGRRGENRFERDDAGQQPCRSVSGPATARSLSATTRAIELALWQSKPVRRHSPSPRMPADRVLSLKDL